MVAALLALATVAFAPLLRAEGTGSFLAPSYSAASIVNAATNAPGSLAPNTIAAVYGTNLAYSTRALAPDDIQNGTLPVLMAGVRIFVAGIPAYLYFVSPQQINLLIPGSLRPGEVDFVIAREGTAGPIVRITLADAAPALFSIGDGLVAATHPDGRIITRDAPALPGELIGLYGAGLGRTSPDVIDGLIPTLALPLRRLDEFRVLLSGEAVPRQRVFYAGLAPGFPGLYQINLWLPERLGADTEIRITLGDLASPAGLKLPAIAPE